MKNSVKTASHAMQGNPVIEIFDKPGDAEKVSRLIRRFAVRREDDTPEEAAIRLATQALMLSNIAAAHLVAEADGEEIELGTGFAVEGGFLSSDIAESVIAPVFHFQERWERNLLHDVDPPAPKQSGKSDSRSKESPVSCDAVLLPAARARNAFSTIQLQELKARKARADARTKDGQARDTREEKDSPADSIEVSINNADLLVMHERQNTVFREILDYRVFICDANTASGLEERAGHAHRGRFLLHARIDSYESLARIGKTIGEFSGRRNIVKGEATMTLRADPVLCLGAGVLNEAIMRGTHRAAGFAPPDVACRIITRL